MQLSSSLYSSLLFVVCSVSVLPYTAAALPLANDDPVFVSRVTEWPFTMFEQVSNTGREAALTALAFRSYEQRQVSLGPLC